MDDRNFIANAVCGPLFQCFTPLHLLHQKCRWQRHACTFGGENLDDSQMQAIAAWTNLAETTFVLAPTTAEADYRVRIFTTRKEIAFAGHPSIGTARAVLETGFAAAREGRLRQECLAGVLPGYGRQTPNDWGLGCEIRDHKSPHWTAPENSPETFGHFGQSGSFLWVDRAAGLAQPLGLLGDGDVGVVLGPRLDAARAHACGVPGGDDRAVMMRGHG